MIIVDFTPIHLEEASALALANYEEERAAVPTLPAVRELPALDEFAENKLGVAAFENGKMTGFLCCYAPWENAFTTTARGTFSPIHAHAATRENRGSTYSRLYQAAAEKWIRAGITSHSLGLYAHDDAALHSFFINGFGLRCVDAVRPMIPLTTDTISPSVTFRQLTANELPLIRDMRRALSRHLGESPCFMYDAPENVERWLTRAEQRPSVIYAAFDGTTAAAFLEVIDDGENFATETPDMRNICGAFCLPAYRGSGLAAALLNFAVTEMQRAGYVRLGVDFESINSHAYGFWLKHFTAYTHGVVRRIDERVLEKWKES